MNPKVSVIVPIYNSAKTLKLCINSIIGQTYSNLEIILINDGSTDNSEEIINTYNDPRIIYIKNNNKGVSATRNYGINISTGEYIIFVDSDDYLNNLMIEKMIKYADSFVICSYHEVSQKDNIIPFAGEKNACIMNIKENFWDLYNEKQAINRPWGKLYNSTIIKENKILFNEKISLGEDLLFNLEYMKDINQLIYIDQGLYFYRIGNPNSLAKKYYSNMLDIQVLLKEKFLSFSEKLDLSNDIKKKIYMKSLRFLLSAASNELHSNKKNKFINMKKIMDNNIIQDYAVKLYKEGYINYLQFFIIKKKMIFTYLILRNKLFN